MLQGDFNHMANVITVLFEQIILKGSNNNSGDRSGDEKMGKSSFYRKLLLTFKNLDVGLDEWRIFQCKRITKYDFFETVYQITSVLGQTNSCLISSLIMIDRFAVKNPSFTITRENIQR